MDSPNVRSGQDEAEVNGSHISIKMDTDAEREVQSSTEATPVGDTPLPSPPIATVPLKEDPERLLGIPKYQTHYSGPGSSRFCTCQIAPF